MTRPFLLTATAAISALALASPASGQAYTRIGGGATIKSSPTVRHYDRTSVNPNKNGDFGKFTDTHIVSDHGLAAEAAIGHDFGPVRLEGQVAWNRVKGRNFGCSDCKPVQNFTTNPIGGSVQTVTGMVNALVDIPIKPVTLSFGGGVGAAYYAPETAKDNGDHRQGNATLNFAWQGIGEARVAVTRKVDLGARYAYQGFNATVEERSRGDRFVAGVRGKVRSQSLMAAITLHLGR